MVDIHNVEPEDIRRARVLDEEEAHDNGMDEDEAPPSDFEDSDQEDLDQEERGITSVRFAPRRFVPEGVSQTLREDSDVEEDEEYFTDYHPSAGTTYGTTPGYNTQGDVLDNPWHPFKSALEFSQVRHFVDCDTADRKINEWFNMGLCQDPSQFYTTSAETIKNRLDLMDPDMPSFKEVKKITEHGNRLWYYRDAIECVKYLFKKRYHKPYTVYAPVKIYNNRHREDRQYSEMHTGDWWWDLQTKIVAGSVEDDRPGVPGATIIPIICSSDETHLTSFSGDKKAWPVYMTLGNFYTSPRQQTNNNAYMVVGVLATKPKLRKVTKKKDEECRQIARECLIEAINDIFGPLKNLPHEGIMMDCPDGMIRKCFPVLSAWCADHMENCELHGCMSNSCPKCLVPPTRLGEYVNPTEPYPERDPEVQNRKYYEYKQVEFGREHRVRRKELKEWFNLNRARMQPNVLSEFPHAYGPEIHAPDLLHNLYLGLFKHICGWLDDFLKLYKRQEIFDDVWMNIRPYPGFRHMNKPYRQISQWTGMDLLNLGRVIVPALAAALDDCTPAEKPYFNMAIACLSSMIGFSMMVGMRIVWDSDLKYIDEYLKRFHATKHIFLRHRTTAGSKQKARTAKKKAELEPKEKFDLEIKDRERNRVPPFTSLQKEARLAEIKKIGDEAYEKKLEEERNFDFIKMHLLSHMKDAIRRKGGNNGTDTQNSEKLHQPEAKAPWESSNKNARAQFYMRVDKEMKDRLTSHRHHLEACMRDFEHKRNSEVQNALNLFKPEDRRTVNALRKKHLPIPANRYPYHDYVEDLLDGEVRLVLISPVGDNKFAKFDKMRGFNHHLHHYLRRYMCENGNEMSVRTSRKLCVREYRILEITRQPFHDYKGCTLDKQIIRCYNKKTFRGRLRNDDVFIEFDITVDGRGQTEFNENGILKINRSMKHYEVAKLVRLLQFWIETPGRVPTRDEIHRVAVVKFYSETNNGNCEDQSGLCRITDRDVDEAGFDLTVVDLDLIYGAAHIVEIPKPNRSIRHRGRQYFVNNTSSLRIFNEIYSRQVDVAPPPDIGLGVDSDDEDGLENEGGEEDRGFGGEIGTRTERLLEREDTDEEVNEDEFNENDLF